MHSWTIVARYNGSEIVRRVGIVSGGELIAERRPSELGRNESLLDAFLENVGGAGATVEGLVGP